MLYRLHLFFYACNSETESVERAENLVFLAFYDPFHSLCISTIAVSTHLETVAQLRSIGCYAFFFAVVMEAMSLRRIVPHLPETILYCSSVRE